MSSVAIPVSVLVVLALLAAVALGVALVLRLRLARDAQRLYRAQRLLERTSLKAMVGGWEYELATGKLNWTAQTHAIHGSTPETFTPDLESCLELCDEASRENVHRAFTRCVRTGAPLDVVARMRTASGARIWVSISGERETIQGRPTVIFGSLHNIDELQRQRLELERSERLYRALAEEASDMVSVHDGCGVFLYASPSSRMLTGYFPHELVGRNVDDFRPADRQADFHEVRGRIGPGAGIGGHYRFVCRDGEIRWLEYRASVMEASELEGEVLVVSRDITERLAAEERLKHLALHDSLTGLPNHAAFNEQLEQMIDRARREGSRLALCFVDTDNFKTINDTCGHTAGDEVLRELARRVRAAVHAGCFVSRFGGDEFAALLPACKDASLSESAAQALIEAFARPIALTDGSVNVTASVGIAHFPDDATSAGDLLSAADMAMYAAKAEGKNTFHRYTSALGSASVAKARAVQEIRGALERRELELFYQPKIRLADGAIAGVEALLRWRRPDGYRGPAELVEAAEASGFIKVLGRWALETAAAQALDWAGCGIACPVAVNVSVRQLHDREFLAHLSDLVGRDARLAGLLELEVTETAIATDAPAVAALLAEIRALGVRVHIDDFGTGYSSLSYLGRLPVDTLKIDRSLVAETPSERDACEIVGAIIALASSLGLETVAEGVETPAQAEFLREAGCTQAQGYLFFRPMTAADAERFLNLRLRSAPQLVSA